MAATMNENHTPDLPEDDDGINLLDILQTLAENARLLIFGPIIVGLVALGVTFLFQPNFLAATSIHDFRSNSRVPLPPHWHNLVQWPGMAGAVSGLKNPAEMYIGLLNSRTIADRMVDRFGMMKIQEREDPRRCP